MTAADAAPGAVRLQGLPPLVAANTRLLVLGSFPGSRSLALGQYYAHPQNQFWRILGALWQNDLTALDYAGRVEAMLARGLGLWDVYASCERSGSLDSAIRHAEPNDFAALAAGTCPQLRAVAHNGGESFRRALPSATLGLAVFRLPSTSPANAAWSFERKRAAWAEVLSQYDLT